MNNFLGYIGDLDLDREMEMKMEMEMGMEMETETETGLDPLLWIAFAGRLVKTFKIGQNVFFFPQGYQEQAKGIVDFSRIPSSIQSCIRCNVLGIEYLANHVTDEVYVKIKLIPIPVPETELCLLDHDDSVDDRDNVNKVESFVKMLTLSGADDDDGYLFSVPKRCADIIFPPFYFGDDDVVNILVKDVNDRIWTFRHNYYYFTTGWRGFVNSKRLVSGDSIVLAMVNNGELRTGIRRRKREHGVGVWNEKKVSPESVIESLNLASRGEAFEVIYYPRLNAPAFCVNAFRVSRSLEIPWCVGSKCKIELESEDSSSTYWVNGTITSIQEFDPNQWKASPWKSIKVKWDDDLEKHLLEKVEFVSPWMIESVVSNIPPPPPPMFSGSIRHVTSAGMQGARQDPNGSSSSSSSMAEYHPGCVSNAGGGEVVTAGKVKDKDDATHFYLFGVPIEKNQSAKSPSEEGNDGGKGDGNEASEK